jgi:TatD DNase family protein
MDGDTTIVVMQYIDTHTHINLAAFKDDYDEVITKTLAEDVWMINIGTQYDTSVFAVELIKKYEKGVYATVGLHPIHTSKSFYDASEFDENERDFINTGEVFDAKLYKELVQHPKVVAIGECGLDYFRDISDEAWKKQIEAFEAQIAFANTVGKPLMLHLRNGARGSAYHDACAILKRDAKVLGNAHFFAGTLEDAKLFWDMGYATSFTGVLTFTHQYNEVVRAAPCELLHAETDAPYVAPVPYRGQRNEPLHVREVVRTMAQIRGVEVPILQQILIENAERMYAIA